MPSPALLLLPPVLPCRRLSPTLGLPWVVRTSARCVHLKILAKSSGPPGNPSGNPKAVAIGLQPRFNGSQKALGGSHPTRSTQRSRGWGRREPTIKGNGEEVALLMRLMAIKDLAGGAAG